MEPFVYTDIFDTKGIEYLIVIGFLVLLIPLWIYLNKPVQVKTGWQRSGALSPARLRIPAGVFLSRNHTWAYLTRSGKANVGLDDLLLHLTGRVRVELVLADGSIVKKGEILARVIQDGKELEIGSPISGRVVQSRHSLEEDSTPMFEDPYGSWLYRIEPENWKEETGPYFLATEAREWIRSELVRFKDFLSGALSQRQEDSRGLVLQEGGELVEFPLSELDGKVWERFRKEFLEL